MNKEEIMQILPHRSSMLLIDEAEIIDGEAHGKKYITGSEFFLDGHFPGNPVVPGVILCEILAQSACVLLTDAARGKKVQTLYTGLDNVRFKNPVRPGDTFETVCRITKNKGVFYFASGEGYVNGKKCLSADFSFAVILEKEE